MLKPTPSDEPKLRDTRERVLAAAVTVFARKGFKGANLDHIAAEAKLTKGAIYWHFRSKNDLFAALLEYRFEQQTAPLTQELALALSVAEPSARQQALVAMLGGMLKRFQEDSDWPRLYLEFISQSRDPDIALRMRALYEHGRAVAADMVERMKQGGLTAANLDTQMAATFWCALLDGFMLAWLLKPETFDNDLLVKQLVAMLWSGMAPKV